MVLRTRPLPQGILRGRYRIAPDLIDRTRDALTSFYEEGRDEGGHEGICFWAGIEGPEQTYFRSVIVPHARHERFGVFVSAVEFGNATDEAHSMGLGILAQVHSHPGSDTRHSDGDDDLVVLPFESMLSVVAPFYGRWIQSISDCSVHQLQNHRWILCSKPSVQSNFATAGNK